MDLADTDLRIDDSESSLPVATAVAKRQGQAWRGPHLLLALAGGARKLLPHCAPEGRRELRV